MDIETQEVHLGFTDEEFERNLAIYESFGWKYTQDVRRGKARYNILARDMDMPNYPVIKALEDKYFALAAKKKEYKPVDFLIAVLLFLLFVAPLVLYLVFKGFQKKRIREHNGNLDRQMNAIRMEASSLL